MAKLQKHFGSSAALAQWLRANATGYGKDSISLLEHCSDKYVEQSREILNRFSESIEVLHMRWGHDIAGAFPDVPAYLAGDPENMYAREWVKSDQTPLHCYIGVSVMASTTTQQMLTRGMALSAFVMAMSEKRPVIITPFVDLGKYGYEGAVVSWDISTQPLVLAELSTSLVEPEVTRTAGLLACRTLNPNVGGGIDPDSNYEDRMRVRLGAKPEDLYLQCVNTDISSDKIIADPVGWVKDRIKEYGGEDES